MIALSALNKVHKTGLFGNCQDKNKDELTTVSEVKNLKIIQVAHYNKSTMKISSINLDSLKFPENSVWELKYPNFDIIGRFADQSTAAAAAAGVAGSVGSGGY